MQFSCLFTVNTAALIYLLHQNFWSSQVIPRVACWISDDIWAVITFAVLFLHPCGLLPPPCCAVLQKTRPRAQYQLLSGKYLTFHVVCTVGLVPYGLSFIPLIQTKLVVITIFRRRRFAFFFFNQIRLFFPKQLTKIKGLKSPSKHKLKFSDEYLWQTKSFHLAFISSPPKCD